MLVNKFDTSYDLGKVSFSIGKAYGFNHTDIDYNYFVTPPEKNITNRA